MADLTSQQFENKGTGVNYQLVVELITGDGKISQSLDNNQLESIEFDMEFNKLVSEGSLIYNDGYGHFNRFLEKQECYIQVWFCRIQLNEDGPVKMYEPHPEQNLRAGFLIQNIEILKRENEYITYKLDFVSLNIYRCLATIDYSNYGGSKKSVFDILKECMKSVDLAVDNETFNMVQTRTQLNYITNGNDNLFSIFKYLFNRLYHTSGLKDDSLKFLLWDVVTQKYSLFDMKNSFLMKNKDKAVLSMMKSDNETMVEPERIKLGSVTQFKTQDLIETFKNSLVDCYNFDDNEFWRYTIEQKKLINFINKRPDNDFKHIDKLTEYQGNPYSIYPFKRGTSWNNDFNFYSQLTRYITKNNTIVLEMAGQILRRPGYVMDIQIDRTNTEVDDESLSKQEDFLLRYKGFEGSWIISRVRNIISFSKKTFRQRITLIRNFTLDMTQI